MDIQPLFNPLSSFNFSLLTDSDFKEDSVREEIIVPILAELGYSHSKPNKIIRSKSLEHPFVSIGSVKKRISIVPDYLMQVNDKYAWILEAKGPNESIVNSSHVEQAYSYAIHSEIRVPYFALCNGKEFVLYHISKPNAILRFETQLLGNYLDNLKKLLAPQNVLNYDYRLAKDFGLHLERLGFSDISSIVLPSVPIPFIGHIGENHFTFSSSIQTEDSSAYVASFDFDEKALLDLEGKIPRQATNLLNRKFEGKIIQVEFANCAYKVTVDCRVGRKLEENDTEIFRPLRINRFL